MSGTGFPQDQLPPYCICHCHDTMHLPGDIVRARGLRKRPTLLPFAPKMTDKLEAGVACVHCQPLHLQALAEARLNNDDQDDGA